MSKVAPLERIEHAFTVTAPRALAHLFTELERKLAEQKSVANGVASLSDAIQELITLLPIAKRIEFQRRFDQIRAGGAPANKGGEVYGQIIALFKRDKRGEWSVPEIFNALGKDGPAPDSKAVYNVIHYLEKKGSLRRVARGRYVVKDWGVGLETNEEFEGADGSPRVSEHDV